MKKYEPSRGAKVSQLTHNRQGWEDNHPKEIWSTGTAACYTSSGRAASPLEMLSHPFV